MYCCICGVPGELMLCDTNDCPRVYCVGCIHLLVGPQALERIQNTKPWYCFLCTPFGRTTHGLIQPRHEVQGERLPRNVPITAIAPANDCDVELTDDLSLNTPPVNKFPNRPLRVLSLFDGIGTGLVILKKLNLQIAKYYSSEINELAINITKAHFDDEMIHLGDVEHITDKQIVEMCPIDLLIGGSPCNDLSLVNPRRRGLFDAEGTGILFFEYYRIMRTIEANNAKTNTHLFWLFENVFNMPKVFKAKINWFFQSKPVVINAEHFSPQIRKRCFWGNIPGMNRVLPIKMEENLADYVISECGRKALVEKINCVTTNPNSLHKGGCKYPIQMNNHKDTPWIIELEKIFGFPPHYTDVGNLTINERQALLGRSWSVPVVCHLLSPLTKYYPTKSSSSLECDVQSSASSVYETCDSASDNDLDENETDLVTPEVTLPVTKSVLKRKRLCKASNNNKLLVDEMLKISKQMDTLMTAFTMRHGDIHNQNKVHALDTDESKNSNTRNTKNKIDNGGIENTSKSVGKNKNIGNTSDSDGTSVSSNSDTYEATVHDSEDLYELSISDSDTTTDVNISDSEGTNEVNKANSEGTSKVNISDSEDINNESRSNSEVTSVSSSHSSDVNSPLTVSNIDVIDLCNDENKQAKSFVNKIVPKKNKWARFLYGINSSTIMPAKTRRYKIKAKARRNRRCSL